MEHTAERKKLKWFLGFVSIILLLTLSSDILISFYGTPKIPKQRNPFVTAPTIIPTPFFTPQPAASVTAFPLVTQPTRISPTPTTIPATGTLCPMDAKMCPDGKTFVGRSGPNCEFIACPKKSKKSKD